jgi:hypothetical protein
MAFGKPIINHQKKLLGLFEKISGLLKRLFLKDKSTSMFRGFSTIHKT